LRPNTEAAYRWELRYLLLPYFAKHRLTDISVELVDRYKQEKLRERDNGRRLSNESINKSLTRLAAILETAVE
jgi:hypothetical protein